MRGQNRVNIQIVGQAVQIYSRLLNRTLEEKKGKRQQVMSSQGESIPAFQLELQDSLTVNGYADDH